MQVMSGIYATSKVMMLLKLNSFEVFFVCNYAMHIIAEIPKANPHKMLCG